MEVKKIVEGMTAPQVAQVIDDNFKAQNKILGDDIATQNNVIGVSEYKDFSEAEAVNVGDVRKYNGLLYECVEATTGAFDASKWKKSSFKAETEKKLSELGSKLIELKSVGENAISSGKTGVEKVGDKYYYTPSNTLYECTEFTDNSNFKVKILEKSNTIIFRCGNVLYYYDGTTLSFFNYVSTEELAETNKEVLEGKRNNEILNNDKANAQKGSNLFNKDWEQTNVVGDYFDKIIVGYRFSTISDYYKEDGYGISPYIEVEPNTEYSSYFSFGVTKLLQYDSDYNYIENSLVSEGTSFVTDGATKYIRFSFIVNGISSTSLEKGNTASKESRYYKPFALEEHVETITNIELKSVGEYTISSGKTGVEKVGDKYFYTISNTLYECIEFTDKSNFKVKVVTPNRTNLYITPNGTVYRYNGTTLINSVIEEIELCDITYQTRSSGKINVSKVGDIYYYYPSNVFYKVKSFTSTNNFEVEVFKPLEHNIFIYGNILYKYTDGHLALLQRVKSNAHLFSSVEIVGPSNSVYFPFPINIKRGKVYTFYGRVTGDFSLIIQHGTDVYTNGTLKITNNSYQVRNYRTNEWGEVKKIDFEIDNFISIAIKEDDFNDKANVVLASSNGHIMIPEIPWNGCRGSVYGYVLSGEFSSCQLSCDFPNVYKDTWFFGDSYFDIWVPKLKDITSGNYMVDGYAGRNSQQAYISLINALEYHIPSRIVWCMGMNDSDVDDTTANSSWVEHYNLVKDICSNLDIELVLATIPLVPNSKNRAKNIIIENSGLEYIDINKAVGGDVSVDWYEGLQLDGIHPTELGGIVIANYVAAKLKNL